MAAAAGASGPAPWRRRRKTSGATLLGYDASVLRAVWANVLSWLVRTLRPAWLPRLAPPPIPQAEPEPDGSPGSETAASAGTGAETDDRTRCVAIVRPGGLEQLLPLRLKAGIATCGYNVQPRAGAFTAPLDPDKALPEDCVLLRTAACSVNYADCCIRWGLYESANAFVGFPIVPGFDVAGVVERAGAASAGLAAGDRAYGCTLFGAYSSRVLVPVRQLRRVPDGLSLADAAALPAVALTALYALFLAGLWPMGTPRYNNCGILVHSAAGGVGSLLVQMARLLGCRPVVGVVGRSDKVAAARALGCHHVIDKSTQDLWEAAAAVCPDGFGTILDANGVATLAGSYAHLTPAGRLVVFGFHSNLPLGRDMLSPLAWLRMARDAARMPRFDAMDMGGRNRSVLAFNLSFLADEHGMLAALFDQVQAWLEAGALQVPHVVQMPLDRVAEAHTLIQSGRSIGKIVLTTSGGTECRGESSARAMDR